MRNKALALLLIFSLAFNIAFVGIWAYRGAARRHRYRRLTRDAQVGRERPPGPGGPPWAQLALAPEQEHRIREGWREVEGQMQSLREEVARHRDALLELMAAEEPEEQAVLAARERIDAVERQMRKLVVGQMLKTREMLTAEQRRQWLRMMRAHGERRGRGRWRGGPRPRRAPGPVRGLRPGTGGPAGNRNSGDTA